MEPNNKKVSTSVLIFLGIVLLAIMSFMIYQKYKVPTVTPAQQVTIEANAVFAQSKLVFPKILGLTSIQPDKFPADTQTFILAGATGQVYNTIQYENSGTGFQSAYLILNSTIDLTMTEFSKQVSSAKIQPPWSASGGFRTGIVGYSDLQQLGGTVQARVSFFQQDKDVKVVIQTLDIKK